MQQLANHCEEVLAIDSDPDAIARARAAIGSETRITFLVGDVMMQPLPDGSFDFITAVAALHHLPLDLALARFRNLLRPGGVLAVIGLYRARALGDYAVAVAAFPVSWMFRCLYGQTAVGAPVQDPKETLHEIRTACDAQLPGAVFRRHLLFRYSMIWRKPDGAVSGAALHSATVSYPLTGC